MKEKPKDMKEGLSSSRKADITHMRTPFLVHGSRACEYGNDKYYRANYARPMGTIQEDFERLRQYLAAAARHIFVTLDEMEYHQAIDPNLEDIEGMKKACYAEDTDAKPGCPTGPSGLPHLCGAVASLNLAITQATRAGLLPADPGTPWKDVAKRKLDFTTRTLADDEGICDACGDVVHRDYLNIISTPTLSGVAMCVDCKSD